MMNVAPLTAKAGTIRNEIKTLVTNNASIAHEDISGKGYQSLAIAKAGTHLVSELVLDYKGWGFTLRYFAQPRKLINDGGMFILVPLSEGVALFPGGRVDEGFSAYLHGEPVLAPNVLVMVTGPDLDG